MVPSVLVSWQSFQVQERINEYFAWLLALETGMIGVFLSFDIVLWYVGFVSKNSLPSASCKNGMSLSGSAEGF